MKYIYEKAQMAVRSLSRGDRPARQRLHDAVIAAQGIILGNFAEGAPDRIRSILAEIEARVAPIHYGQHQSLEASIADLSDDDINDTVDLFLRLLDETAEEWTRQEGDSRRRV